MLPPAIPEALSDGPAAQPLTDLDETTVPTDAAELSAIMDQLLADPAPRNPEAQASLHAHTEGFLRRLTLRQWNELAYQFPSKDCSFPEQPDEQQTAREIHALLGLPERARVQDFRIEEVRVDIEGIKGLSRVSMQLGDQQAPHVVTVVWWQNCGDWRAIAAEVH
jgi:hypothetical protein